MAISKKEVVGLANKELPPDKQATVVTTKDNAEMHSGPVILPELPNIPITTKMKIVAGTQKVPKISNQPEPRYDGGKKIKLSLPKIEKKG